MIEIYSSIECPFAYLAVYRLRQVWSEIKGSAEIAHPDTIKNRHRMGGLVEELRAVPAKNVVRRM